MEGFFINNEEFCILVVGIEDTGDSLGTLRRSNRSFVVSSVERLQIESGDGLGGPESDVVDYEDVVFQYLEPSPRCLISTYRSWFSNL